jgi:hypothetical protein
MHRFDPIMDRIEPETVFLQLPSDLPRLAFKDDTIFIHQNLQEFHPDSEVW